MLAWLVNSKYLSRGELMDPCYTVLKITDVLYPGGQPISMDGFTGYQAEKPVAMPTIASMSGGSSHHHHPLPSFSHPSTSTAADKDKPDWWNMEVDFSTGEPVASLEIPKAAPLPPPLFGGPDVDMDDPYNPVYWGGQGSSTPSSTSASLSGDSAYGSNNGDNHNNRSQNGRTVAEWAGDDCRGPNYGGHPSPQQPSTSSSSSQGPHQPRPPVGRYFTPEMMPPPMRSRYQHPADQHHHHPNQNYPQYSQYGQQGQQGQYPSSPNGGQQARQKTQTLDFSKTGRSVVPVDAGPGNFTLDNAKQLLNQFMQLQKIKADYEYDARGPAHRKLVFKIFFYYL